MGTREVARELLAAARTDLKALTHMLDAEAFDDQVFGFHAQQAVEKALKAWLNLLGEIHPYTHNLRLLLDKLNEHEAAIDAYWDFVDLSSYAMQLRYESPSTEDEPLSRDTLLADVRALVEHVEELVG